MSFRTGVQVFRQVDRCIQVDGSKVTHS